MRCTSSAWRSRRGESKPGEILPNARADRPSRHRFGGAATLDRAASSHRARSRRDTASADADACALAIEAFHEAILRATTNELMDSLFCAIERPSSKYMEVAALPGERVIGSPLDYDEVCEAIRRRRPEAARQAMRKIVANAGHRIRRVNGCVSSCY